MPWLAPRVTFCLPWLLAFLCCFLACVAGGTGHRHRRTDGGHHWLRRGVHVPSLPSAHHRRQVGISYALRCGIIRRHIWGKNLLYGAMKWYKLVVWRDEMVQTVDQNKRPYQEVKYGLASATA